MYRAHFRRQPIAVFLILGLIWGTNVVIIKIGGYELLFLFMGAKRTAAVQSL